MTTKNKKTAKKTSTRKSNGVNPVAVATPEGYESRSTGDIEGFWTGEGAIHFIPKGFALFDSKLESSKPSVLIIGTLIDTCVLTDSDGEQAPYPKGTTVGVWGKPGMRALLQLGGEPTFMFEDGEKDVGKPNAMKVYEVKSKNPGAPLQCLRDDRDDSIASPCWAIPRKRRAARPTADDIERENAEAPIF